MTEIVTMLEDKAIELLTAQCITAIEDDDPTLVGLIVRAPMQQDPVAPGNSLVVWTSDPEGKSMEAHSVQQRKAFEPDESETLRPYFREVGGGYGNMRILWIQIRCFTGNVTREQSSKIANTLRQRVERTMMSAEFLGLTDDFNETVYDQLVMAEIMLPSGGENQKIYDGNVKTQFWTYVDS